MFVVCGEALMDVFAAGDTPTGMALDARIGGSPFNVAVGLARLAQPVAFFGAVSTRLPRRAADARAARRGRGHRRRARALDAPTTLGLVGLDAHGVPSYSFYGDGCADRLLPLDALAALPAAARALPLRLLSRRWSSRSPSTLRALVEREHARSADRLRPEHPPQRRARPRALARHAALDAAAHPPAEDQRRGPAAAATRARTPSRLRAPTALAAGVELRRRDARRRRRRRPGRAGEHVSAPPVPVTVVDTVGAGDTFQAALLTWLAEHDALSRARRCATGGGAAATTRWASPRGAAAITCSRRGADLPRRDELR